MKIGILITSISNFGQKGFYNAQEIGLAKALSKKFDDVKVYKLVSFDEERKIETIKNSPNVKVYFIPSKNHGINGVINVSILDKELDALIHFSDTQFSVPTVYKWCKKSKVIYIPYIGVVESHSTSKIKRFITNIMFRRNIDIYKKCSCCVKTPFVQNELKTLGVNETIVTPVGLDLDLLKDDFTKYDVIALKKKYGYKKNDKVILFVGRLIDEKQPIRMLEIFADVLKIDNNYKLMMIGTGELMYETKEKIKELDLENSTRMIERIPNSDIWELYRIADAFVNLNRQEIFGMAILEAMYYGCKVIAWKAPGPNLIIENKVSGYLVENNQEVITTILKSNSVDNESHKRILSNFIWNKMVNKVYEMIKNRD